MTGKKENAGASHILASHILVPLHSKLGEKDKKELLKAYRITIRELPKIFATDAAIASLDAKQGDIIKITRKSPTAGETVFYRGVLNA